MADERGRRRIRQRRGPRYLQTSRRQRRPVKPAAVGRDPGRDRAGKTPARRPTHSKRMQQAINRLANIGLNLGWLRSQRKRAMITHGPMASCLCGWRVYGEAPAAVAIARRRCTKS
eukprot:2898595-Pyramimonas_sp.AAC.1